MAGVELFDYTYEVRWAIHDLFNKVLSPAEDPGDPSVGVPGGIHVWDSIKDGAEHHMCIREPNAQFKHMHHAEARRYMGRRGPAPSTDAWGCPRVTEDALYPPMPCLQWNTNLTSVTSLPACLISPCTPRVKGEDPHVPTIVWCFAEGIVVTALLQLWVRVRAWAGVGFIVTVPSKVSRSDCTAAERMLLATGGDFGKPFCKPFCKPDILQDILQARHSANPKP